MTIKQIAQNQYLEIIARWFIGFLFIYASIHKIQDPETFAKIIYGYNLFPKILINIMAIVLPFIELTAGIALIAGVVPRAASLVINCMLLGFILALTFNLIRGYHFDCGCFTFSHSSASLTTEQSVVHDIVYFLIGLYVLFYRKTRLWCIHQTGGLLNNI